MHNLNTNRQGQEANVPLNLRFPGWPVAPDNPQMFSAGIFGLNPKNRKMLKPTRTQCSIKMPELALNELFWVLATVKL